MGVGAGCSSISDAPQDNSSADGSGSNIAEGTVQPAPGTELYVDQNVANFPQSPDIPSFGITAEGIFQHNGTSGGWSPIQYGSDSSSIPKIVAQTATVGSDPSGRPLISNGRQVVYVDPVNGDDSADGSEDAPLRTVQEAVQRAPIYLRHQYVIDLATVPNLPVTYDEDILVPAIIGTGQAGKENGAPQRGPYLNLDIRGDSDDASAVKIGSIMFGNVIGTAAGNVFSITITRDSPYDDEQHGLSAYGNSEVSLYDITFAGGSTNGILAYGARIKAEGIDFGQRNLGVGLKAKRHASIIIDESVGETTGDAFRATENSKITIRDETSVTGNPQYNTLRGGLLFDEESDTWYGISGTSTTDSPGPAGDSAESRLRLRSDHPESTSPGEMWYVDGSGEVAEGFYGRLESGIEKIK